MVAQRAGLSVVESLVVLAITSLLLIALFSAASQGVRAGFNLSSRSIDTADRAVGVAGLRELLRGVRLPGADRRDAPFEGEPSRLTAAVIPLRTTPCAGAAPSRVRLEVTQENGRTRLTCRSPGGEATVLIDLGARPAAFSYALAGRPWTDHLSARPVAATARGAQPPASARLWMRLASDDGTFAVIEAVDPGPPLREAPP